MLDGYNLSKQQIPFFKTKILSKKNLQLVIAGCKRDVINFTNG